MIWLCLFIKQCTITVTLTFDLWRSNYFCLWIDYDPISVLYQFQIDMSTNSRDIKYQNIEKFLFLITERLVFMATKKTLLGRFSRKTFGMVLGPEYISWHKIRTIGPVLWPVHREQTDKHANRGDQHTLRKSKISQSKNMNMIWNYIHNYLCNINS